MPPRFGLTVAFWSVVLVAVFAGLALFIPPLVLFDLLSSLTMLGGIYGLYKWTPGVWRVLNNDGYSREGAGILAIFLILVFLIGQRVNAIGVYHFEWPQADASYLSSALLFLMIIAAALFSRAASFPEPRPTKQTRPGSFLWGFIAAMSVVLSGIGHMAIEKISVVFTAVLRIFTHGV